MHRRPHGSHLMPLTLWAALPPCPLPCLPLPPPPPPPPKKKDMLLSALPLSRDEHGAYHPPLHYVVYGLRLALFAVGVLLGLTAYDALGAALSMLGGLGSISASLVGGWHGVGARDGWLAGRQAAYHWGRAASLARSGKRCTVSHLHPTRPPARRCCRLRSLRCWRGAARGRPRASPWRRCCCWRAGWSSSSLA